MEISKVFVLGSGTMGNGIAQVCAQCGISVVMCDLSQDILDKAVKFGFGQARGKAAAPLVFQVDAGFATQLLGQIGPQIGRLPGPQRVGGIAGALPLHP